MPTPNRRHCANDRLGGRKASHEAQTPTNRVRSRRSCHSTPQTTKTKSRHVTPPAAPKLFISYSWTTPDHEEWVLDLATELRSCGVDVVLDKWELKEGHDKHAFMERMITDTTVTKVLMICDRMYAEKADGRSGGVGTETQIITPELYGKTAQSRFVAVVVEKDGSGRPLVPTFYTSRIHIDMSSDELRAANFERLLRWIFDKPLDVKPELGKPPAFLHEGGSRGTPTEALARRTVEGFRTGKPYADGSLREYLDALSAVFAGFRLAPSGGSETFDEQVLASVEKFQPVRDEYLTVLTTVTRYGPPHETASKLHGLFESIVPHLSASRGAGSYHRWDADNLRFLAQELFLHTTAVLLRVGWFEGVGSLCASLYFAGDERQGPLALRGFGVFRSHLDSLTHRKQRLKLLRHSLAADVLKERCASGPVKFEEVMQADFVLFIADAVIALRERRQQEWWPDTLVYRTFAAPPFPLFVRATSRSFFDALKVALGIEKKEDLAAVLQALASESLRVPTWQTDSISPRFLMSWDTLATRA